MKIHEKLAMESKSLLLDIFIFSNKPLTPEDICLVNDYALTIAYSWTKDLAYKSSVKR
jgi:hypothetical protein